MKSQMDKQGSLGGYEWWWRLTFTAKTFSCLQSRTFRTVPNDPLATKPRICKGKKKLHAFNGESTLLSPLFAHPNTFSIFFLPHPKAKKNTHLKLALPHQGLNRKFWQEEGDDLGQGGPLHHFFLHQLRNHLHPHHLLLFQVIPGHQGLLQAQKGPPNCGQEALPAPCL